MADKHTLAFEIGVEEIPAFDLDSANKQLEKMVPAAFPMRASPTTPSRSTPAPVA